MPFFFVEMKYQEEEEADVKSRCGICAKDATNEKPVQLQCSHTFCLLCLKSNHDAAVRNDQGESDKIYCPRCAEVTALPDGSVENIRPFYVCNRVKDLHALSQMNRDRADPDEDGDSRSYTLECPTIEEACVPEVEEEYEGGQHPFSCGQCRGAGLVYYCFHCGRALCVSCRQHHDDLDENRNHFGVDVDNDTIVRLMCEAHEQFATQYCLVCLRPVCNECPTSTHLDHDFGQFCSPDEADRLITGLRQRKDEVGHVMERIERLRRSFAEHGEALASDIDRFVGETLLSDVYVSPLRRRVQDSMAQAHRDLDAMESELQRSKRTLDAFERIHATRAPVQDIDQLAVRYTVPTLLSMIRQDDGFSSGVMPITTASSRLPEKYWESEQIIVQCQTEDVVGRRIEGKLKRIVEAEPLAQEANESQESDQVDIMLSGHATMTDDTDVNNRVHELQTLDDRCTSVDNESLLSETSLEVARLNETALTSNDEGKAEQIRRKEEDESQTLSGDAAKKNDETETVRRHETGIELKAAATSLSDAVHTTPRSASEGGDGSGIRKARMSWTRHEQVWSVKQSVRSVDFLADGTVLAAGRGAVHAYDGSGRRLPPPFSAADIPDPWKLAVDRKSCAVVVVDPMTNAFTVFAPEGGSPSGRWRRVTHTIGGVHVPMCAAFADDGHILLGTGSGRTLLKYSRAGEPLWETTLAHDCYYLTVDADGRIVTSGGGGVRVHDRSGQQLLEFPIDRRRLRDPWGVCTDADNNIYVCELNQPVVTVFSPAGDYIRQLDTHSWPRDIAFKDNKLVIASVNKIEMHDLKV